MNKTFSFYNIALLWPQTVLRCVCRMLTAISWMSSARRHVENSVNDRKLGLRELGAEAARKVVARGAVCIVIRSSVRSGFCELQ